MYQKPPKQKKIVTNSDEWNLPLKTGRQYFGIFNGLNVLITDKTAMSDLYFYGNFGKGSLSKSVPTHDSIRDDIPEIITTNQWERRRSWMSDLQKYSPDTLNHMNDKFKYSNTEKSLENLNNLREHELTNGWSKVKPCTSYTLPPASQNTFQLTETTDEIDSQFSRQWMNKLNSNFWLDLCPNEPENNKDELWTIINKKECNWDSVATSTRNSSVIVTPQVTHLTTIDNIFNKSRLEHEQVQTVRESLVLTLQESFFLCYVLGCLSVEHENKVLTPDKLWCLLTHSEVGFISKYIAYHYYRSKGWIVKSGVKYGGDYLLYMKGPAYYHASYVIIIEEVDENFERKEVLTWKRFLGLNRMLETANKELILFQVYQPTEITQEELASPEVLHKFKVNEILSRRWIPASENKTTKN